MSYARGNTSVPFNTAVINSFARIVIGSVRSSGPSQLGSLEADEFIFFFKALGPDEITALYDQHK